MFICFGFHVKNSLNEYKPNIDKNHRISKIPAFKIYKEPVDAIWVGSSKTGWSSNEEYEKSVLNSNIKNLTLNGSSFLEAITMAKNAIQIHPEIKTVYFGIDFCMMKKYVEKPDALKPISKTNLTKEEILPLLISLDTIQHSTKTFSKNLKKERLWKTLNIKIPHVMAVVFTFFFVNITWVYFRATSIEKANYIIKSMFGLNGFEPLAIDKLRLSFENGSIKLSLLMLIGTIILLFIPNSVELSKKFKPNAIFFTVTLVLMLISILSINKVSEFLYFQF